MAPSLLIEFLNLARKAPSQSPDVLASLLDPDPTYIFANQSVQALRLELVSNPRLIESKTETIISDDWLAYQSLIVKYLLYVAACDEALVTTNDKALVAWYAKLKDYTAALQTTYASGEGVKVVKLVSKTAKILAKFALFVDGQLMDAHEKAANEAIGIIQRSFGTALSSNRDPGAEGKRGAIFALANSLFKLWMKTGQSYQCGQLHRQLVSQRVLGNLHLYSAATRATFLYYQGHMYLHRDLLTLARSSFEESYSLTHPELLRQRRKILIYLLVVSLILGTFPTPALLARPEAEGLSELFTPLVYAIKTGDFRSFRIAIGEEGSEDEMLYRKNFWWGHGVYLLLRTKAQQLVWRSLVKATYRATWTNSGPPHVTTADLIVTVAALHRASPTPKPAQRNPLFFSGFKEDDDEDEEESYWYSGGEPTHDEMESVCMSMIDSGFVRGYFNKRAGEKGGILVLAPEGQVQFPEIAEMARVKAEREREVVGREVGGGVGGVVRLSGVKEIGG